MSPLSRSKGVALHVRAAGLPERAHVGERQRFLAEHQNLLVDLQPRHLVFLEEHVARLVLFRGVEDAVDVLRHESGIFYHARDRSQTLLTDPKSTQEVSLLGIYREQRLIITSASVTGSHRIDHLESVTGADETAPC